MAITKKYRSKGFSLIEMMVSITIGLIILAAASLVLVQSKKNYTTQDGLARLQETARFALHLITQDLQHAGFFGCAERQLDITSRLAGNPGIGPFPLEGSDGNGGAASFYPSGSALPSGVLATTDVLHIRAADPSTTYQLTSDMVGTGQDLSLTPATGISANDYLLVSDCDGGDIVAATGVSGGTVQYAAGGLNASAANGGGVLSKPYTAAGTRIYKFIEKSYYIQQKTDGRTALYQRASNGNAQELLEGVESIQITYGEDLDGDRRPDRYSVANSVSNWQNIVTLQLGLMISTIDEQGSDFDQRGTLTLNGQALTIPSDRRTRRLFTTTVQLRNLTNEEG